MGKKKRFKVRIDLDVMGQWRGDSTLPKASNRYRTYYLYVFIQHFHGQDVTQGQFLSRVMKVWIKTFSSSRLVAYLKLKRPICPTIYLEKKNRWIHAFPKSIRVKGKANSFIQDLNLGCQFHFQPRQLFICIFYFSTGFKETGWNQKQNIYTYRKVSFPCIWKKKINLWMKLNLYDVIII